METSIILVTGNCPFVDLDKKINIYFFKVTFGERIVLLGIIFQDLYRVTHHTGKDDTSTDKLLCPLSMKHCHIYSKKGQTGVCNTHWDCYPWVPYTPLHPLPLWAFPLAAPFPHAHLPFAESEGGERWGKAAVMCMGWRGP
ncbi:hypothetical protein XENTR_v10003693 [Xenopus tropicalis]|nr:hypothetical protein XENTR_v10003693 [Xenopus tropicalis]